MFSRAGLPTLGRRLSVLLQEGWYFLPSHLSGVKFGMHKPYKRNDSSHILSFVANLLSLATFEFLSSASNLLRALLFFVNIRVYEHALAGPKSFRDLKICSVLRETGVVTMGL